MMRTVRFTMFGAAMASIGLIAGASLTGNMSMLAYWLCIGVFVVLQFVGMALDRREHRRFMADFDEFEASLDDLDDALKTRRPSLSVLHGGRLQ